MLFTIGKAISSITSVIVLIGNIIEFIVNGTFDSSGIEIKATSWLLSTWIIGFDVYIGTYIAKKFGKSSGFGIGLGLLPIVFAPILAFGKAEFQEKEYI